MLRILSVILILVKSNAHAAEFTIPDIATRVSDQYMLDSIAKLDDFIEDIQKKEAIKGVETVGFLSAGLVHLGTITGSLIDHFITKQKLFKTTIKGISDVNSMGKAGTLPSRLMKFSRRWMTTASAVNSVKSEQERIFIVHRDDLPVFRSILNEVRQQQVSILTAMWKQKKVPLEQLQKIDYIIIENRPSFKKIYEPCVADPFMYKVDTSLRVYRYSIFDYLGFATIDPDLISSQYNSGIVSPTIRNYINQEVLPFALKKCFKVKQEASGFFEDSSDRFVAQLLAIEGASKFVVGYFVYRVFFKKKNLNATPSRGALERLQTSNIGPYLKPVFDLFAKISPTLIAKIFLGTQLAASSYALYSITHDYSKAQEDAIKRHTSEEFKTITKKIFHERAVNQLKFLQELKANRDLDGSDIESLETEITNWSLVEMQFRS